jgi:hypothetical protein
MVLPPDHGAEHRGEETWFVIRVCTQSPRYAKADRFDIHGKSRKGRPKSTKCLLLTVVAWRGGRKLRSGSYF